MPLSVADIIQIAEKSQYLAVLDIQRKGLLGGGVNERLPHMIYAVRKSVDWIQDRDGVRSETPATATIEITAIGVDGDSLTVNINDPVLGAISLGTYVKVTGDSTVNILAQSIATELANNAYNYSISVDENVITIQAAPGRGSDINGDNRLTTTGDIPDTITQFSGGIPSSTGDENVIKTANYLYWLCGTYALTAQGITGTGSVSPIASAPSAPPPYDFEVTNTSFIIAGQSNKTINAFIGYNIQFYRNGFLQSIVDTGGTYYTWNSVTGLLTLFGEAQAGEVFQIYPV